MKSKVYTYNRELSSEELSRINEMEQLLFSNTDEVKIRLNHLKKIKQALHTNRQIESVRYFVI